MGNLNPLPCPFGQATPFRRGQKLPVSCYFTFGQSGMPLLSFSKPRFDLDCATRGAALGSDYGAIFGAQLIINQPCLGPTGGAADRLELRGTMGVVCPANAGVLLRDADAMTNQLLPCRSATGAPRPVRPALITKEGKDHAHCNARRQQNDSILKIDETFPFSQAIRTDREHNQVPVIGSGQGTIVVHGR